MKKLSSIIGQKEALAQLNGIIAAYNEATKAGKPFQWLPIKFDGLSGMGKGYLAEAFAEAVGLPLITMPINAGWTWAKEMAKETTSEDKETGATSPLPATIFVDEAHCQKTLSNMIKKWTEKPFQILTRNGYTWHCDRESHLWIFATNEKMDTALESRCLIQISLVPYSKGEKKQIIQESMTKEIDSDALDFVETRTKPVARDCKAIAANLSLILGERVTLAQAKEKVANMGRFNLGVNRPEIRGLEALNQNPLNIYQLKHKMGLTGQTAEKQVKESMGWLAAMGLVSQPSASSFAILKEGKTYLDKLASDIKKAKAPAVVA